jgi:hypothetical protein
VQIVKEISGYGSATSGYGRVVRGLSASLPSAPPSCVRQARGKRGKGVTSQNSGGADSKGVSHQQKFADAATPCRTGTGQVVENVGRGLSGAATKLSGEWRVTGGESRWNRDGQNAWPVAGG